MELLTTFMEYYPFLRNDFAEIHFVVKEWGGGCCGEKSVSKTCIPCSNLGHSLWASIFFEEIGKKTEAWF